MKALFVINERSGRRRSYDVREVIRRASPFEHDIVGCGAKQDLIAIVDRAEREQFDILYAVGGDGTVHEAAKRLVGRKPALGVLPIGSGNGFARHIGLPIHPARSLTACRGGRIATIDTGEVNGVPFLGVMGLGFDALIAERFAENHVRGLRSYVKFIVFAFPLFRGEEYEIASDGITVKRCAFLIAIANSGQYGNNARIAPLASLQDGELDLVVVDDMSLPRALLLIPRLFLGTVHRARQVMTRRARAVTIRRQAAGAVHLDGEPYVMGEELRVRVVPQSLRVLVPDSATTF